MFQLLLLVVLNNNINDVIEYGVYKESIECHAAGSELSGDRGGDEPMRITYDCIEVK